MKKCLPFLLVLFNLLVIVPQNAYAQKTMADLTANLNYTEISRRLVKIEQTLKKGDTDPKILSEYMSYINDNRLQLTKAKVEIEKDLKFVEKRIEALGEQPKEGGKEVDIIAQKRKEFNTELATEKGKIAEVDILLTKLDELDATIFNIRNQALLGNLLIRSDNLFNPTVLFDSTKKFVAFFFDIIKSPVGWYSELNEEEKIQVQNKWLPVSFLIFFALWIGIYLRLFIMRKFGYKKDIEHPRYGKKVSAAIFVAIAYGVIPSTIIGFFLAWIVGTKIFTAGLLGLVIKSLLYYSLYVILARAVSRVIFAPHNEKWRLVNVDNEKAKLVTSALYFSVTLIGIFAFLEHVARLGNYSLELIAFISSLSSAAKAFCIIFIAKRFIWDGDDDTETEKENDENDEAEEKANVPLRITLIVSFFAIVVFGLSLFGYQSLAAFILNRFIFSFVVVGIFFVLRKILSEILHRLLLLRFWVKTFKLRRKILHKLDFWSSLVIDPLFVLMGIFSLLALWGVSTDVLKQMVMKLLFGFTVGGVKISLISIVLGILIFFVSITVVKALRRRLADNVLAKMDIDDGIKHSLASGFGSIGFIISALLSIAIMGGNLSNFALIAGALSFGVGLGLQNVVNNFISGIILLFERPIKVGDWIIVNGQEGVVKQINIRSTELETWKRASIIIPNSDLLSSIVTNLTHDDKWGRLDIKIGVAYGSDIEKVRDILIEAANNNKRVLKKPAAYAVFVDFGSSSLDFELRCFTADIMNGLTISSEIRFEINRRFIEENIEIPFPQQVLHLGDPILKDAINASLLQSLKKPKEIK